MGKLNKRSFLYIRICYTLWLVNFDKFCQLLIVTDADEKCVMAPVTVNQMRLRNLHDTYGSRNLCICRSFFGLTTLLCLTYVYEYCFIRVRLFPSAECCFLSRISYRSSSGHQAEHYNCSNRIACVHGNRNPCNSWLAARIMGKQRRRRQRRETWRLYFC